MRSLAISTALLVTLSAACGDRDPVPPAEGAPDARIALTVSALTLSGVTDATYTITVRNTATPAATVWSRQVSSSAFGTGSGDLTYIGPCDTTTAQNTVHLRVDALLGPGGAPLTDWMDPGELIQSFPCVANADTPVTFGITVARRAQQGFFDVAVSFDDVFCSAKLDCVDAFLHNAAGERDTTAIVAFACTTGAGTATVLHLADIELDCTDGRRVVNPALGPGNTGQTSEHIFQVATYRGREDLAPYEKCYWNTAIGLDLGSFEGANPPVDCTLRARATASQVDWADGMTPEGHVWPYIEWERQIITANALTCGEYPLDQPGSGVRTVYAVPPERERFQTSLVCADCDGQSCPTNLKGNLCAGSVGGVSGPVFFADTPDGLVVTIEGQQSAAMALPEGYALQGCCADPCCGE